jgi:hypothetical protein
VSIPKLRKFARLSDRALLRVLAALLAKERAFTADVVACIAEVESRQLYREAGYPSMYAFCVGVLHLTEAAAYKRIEAGRAAQQFPEILCALAEGRLHLTAVVMLAPKLTPANAGELLAAATHRTKREIELLLAERFPRPDLPERIRPLAPAAAEATAAAPANFANSSALPTTTSAAELAPGRVAPADEQPILGPTAPTPAPAAPGRMKEPGPTPRVTPLAPQRFALQLTIGESTHQKLRYAQELLGHYSPTAELALVLDRALDALIAQLERAKFAATEQPRSARRPARGSRTIPARVKRAVWKRDKGRCTFVSDSGHRCEEKTDLEFNHKLEFARGGEATVEEIELLCRAHNQFKAERTFGAEFMRHKRAEARGARAEARRPPTRTLIGTG